MGKAKRRLLWAFWLLALAGCVGVWAIGSLLTRATNSEVTIDDPAAQSMEIASTGDIRLAASYWPTSSPDAPAILMLHGNGSNRSSTAQTASWLNAHGYAVLAIDFRGHGQSTPKGKSFGLYEAEDARAALAWLREQHPNSRVGIIGFSLGGAASLIGEQGPLPVDALVLEGVYPDIRNAIHNRLALRLGEWPASLVEPLLSYQSLPRFGVWPEEIAPIKALERVDIPVMIVGGGDDANTPPSETRAMYEAVKQNGELHILPGVSHDALGRDQPEAFKQALLAFLDRNLKR